MQIIFYRMNRHENCPSNYFQFNNNVGLNTCRLSRTILKIYFILYSPRVIRSILVESSQFTIHQWNVWHVCSVRVPYKQTIKSRISHSMTYVCTLQTTRPHWKFDFLIIIIVSEYGINIHIRANGSSVFFPFFFFISAFSLL